MSRNKAYEKGLDAYGQFVLVREQVIDMKKNQKLLEKKRKREGMSDNEIAFEVEETAVILGDLEKKAEKLKEKMMNLFTKSIDGKYSEEMFEDINLMTHDVQKRMDPMDSNPMDSDLNKTFLEAMTQFDNFDRSRDALKALTQEIDSIKRSGSTSTDSKLRQTTERFENLKENCKMQQKIVRDLLKNAYAVENDSEKRIDIQALMSSLEMFDPDNWQGHNKSVPKVKNRSATFLAPKIPSPKPVQAPRGLRSVKKHKSRLQLPSRVKPSLYGMTHSVELAKNEARREKLLKPPGIFFEL